jgi:hypothetical protein
MDELEDGGRSYQVLCTELQPTAKCVIICMITAVVTSVMRHVVSCMECIQCGVQAHH